jgi:hypothetical protein
MDNTCMPPLTQKEIAILDRILGEAALSREKCDRLLQRCDDQFLQEYGLNEQRRWWLRGIQAHSLQDLARAIYAAHY